MTREEALRMSLATASDIPTAIKQAEEILRFLGGDKPNAVAATPSASLNPYPIFTPWGLEGPRSLAALPQSGAGTINREQVNAQRLPRQILPASTTSSRYAGVPEEYHVLLGGLGRRIYWTESNKNVLLFHLETRSQSALFDAAVELNCSVKACYDEFLKMPIRKTFTAEENRKLLQVSREHLVNLTGSHGTMY